MFEFLWTVIVSLMETNFVSYVCVVLSVDVVKAVLGPVIDTLSNFTPCLNSVFVNWFMSCFWNVLSLYGWFGISPVRIC